MHRKPNHLRAGVLCDCSMRHVKSSHCSGAVQYKMKIMFVKTGDWLYFFLWSYGEVLSDTIRRHPNNMNYQKRSPLKNS